MLTRAAAANGAKASGKGAAARRGASSEATRRGRQTAQRALQGLFCPPCFTALYVLFFFQGISSKNPRNEAKSIKQLSRVFLELRDNEVVAERKRIVGGFFSPCVMTHRPLSQGSYLHSQSVDKSAGDDSVPLLSTHTHLHTHTGPSPGFRVE